MNRTRKVLKRKNNKTKNIRTKKINRNEIIEINQEGGSLYTNLNNSGLEFRNNYVLTIAGEHFTVNYTKRETSFIYKLLIRLKNNMKCRIEDNDYDITNLKIQKVRIKLTLYTYHFFLVLYFSKTFGSGIEVRFILASFSGAGVNKSIIGSKVYNALIIYPDPMFKIKPGEINKTKFRIDNYLKKGQTDNKKDVVDVNPGNINYLINLFYIYNFLNLFCPKCTKNITFVEQECSLCNYKLVGINDTTLFDNLKYYKIQSSRDEKHNYKYYIMYGMYSSLSIKGINCQTFANLFINIMRKNPFRYISSIFKKNYKSLVKRLQMMKYLFDINNKFLENNRELMSKDDIKIFEDIKLEYNKYLSEFLLDEYCFTEIKTLGTPGGSSVTKYSNIIKILEMSHLNIQGKTKELNLLEDDTEQHEEVDPLVNDEIETNTKHHHHIQELEDLIMKKLVI